MVAVEERGAATQEIARNVKRSVKGARQVCSGLAEVQREADETESALTFAFSSRGLGAHRAGDQSSYLRPAPLDADRGSKVEIQKM